MKWLFIIVIFFCVDATAEILRVGKDQPFTSVTAALSAANDKDTIAVSAGKYFEKNIIINKQIFIYGVGYPVLDGEYLYEIISVKANNVHIQGFVLQHTGRSGMNDFAAIKMYDCHNVIINDNIIKDAFFGIYAQYSINCTIKNNTLEASQMEEQQSGNGIHCWKSDSMLIIANKITGHRDGIYFEFVTHSVIWRNISQKNIRYGLHFMFSNNDAYISNIFENNGAGVAVMFSHGVKMFNNYFSKNWGDAAYGILLKEISDSYIQANHFNNNTMAVYAEGASRIQISKNVFKDNGWAFKIQASCMDIEVVSNNFLGNTFDIGTNGSLVLNIFKNNYWDKYEGYDLDRNNIGDVPYRPVSLYGMIVEQNPTAMILFHSLITTLMDRSEKIIPGLTPHDLIDNFPMMKPVQL